MSAKASVWWGSSLWFMALHRQIYIYIYKNVQMIWSEVFLCVNVRTLRSTSRIRMFFVCLFFFLEFTEYFWISNGLCKGSYKWFMNKSIHIQFDKWGPLREKTGRLQIVSFTSDMRMKYQIQFNFICTQ